MFHFYTINYLTTVVFLLIDDTISYGYLEVDSLVWRQLGELHVQMYIFTAPRFWYYRALGQLHVRASLCDFHTYPFLFSVIVWGL